LKKKFIYIGKLAKFCDENLVHYQGKGSLFFAIYKTGKKNLKKFLSNLSGQDKLGSGDNTAPDEINGAVDVIGDNDNESHDEGENDQGTGLMSRVGNAFAQFVGWPNIAGNSGQNSLKAFMNREFKAAEQEAAKITDIDFIMNLYGDHDFTVLESEKKSIKDKFMKLYKSWKEKKDWSIFLNRNTRLDYYKIHSIKYREETDAMHKEIANDLVYTLESMYSKGYVFIHVTPF